jgi:AMMECR1 domain-containing protein
MIAELYDALREAGASEDKARAASRALADYDSRFNKVDQELVLIKAEITVLKWMHGFLVAGMVSLLYKAFVQ